MAVDGTFKKGEVITIQPIGQSMGTAHEDKRGNEVDSRFVIMTLADMDVEEASYLTRPLNYEFPELQVDNVVEEREFVLDVDALKPQRKQVLKAELVAKTTIKQRPKSPLKQSVVV